MSLFKFHIKITQKKKNSDYLHVEDPIKYCNKLKELRNALYNKAFQYYHTCILVREWGGKRLSAFAYGKACQEWKSLKMLLKDGSLVDFLANLENGESRDNVRKKDERLDSMKGCSFKSLN